MEIPSVKKQEFSFAKSLATKIAEWLGALSEIPTGLWFESYSETIDLLKDQAGWDVRKKGEGTTNYKGRPFNFSPHDVDANSVDYQAQLLIFRVTFHAIHHDSDNWLWFTFEFKKDGTVTCYPQYATNEVEGILKKVAKFFDFPVAKRKKMSWQQAYDLLCAMQKKENGGVPEFMPKD